VAIRFPSSNVTRLDAHATAISITLAALIGPLAVVITRLQPLARFGGGRAYALGRSLHRRRGAVPAVRDGGVGQDAD